MINCSFICTVLITALCYLLLNSDSAGSASFGIEKFSIQQDGEHKDTSLEIKDNRIFNLRDINAKDEKELEFNKADAKDEDEKRKTCTCGDRNEEDRIVGGRSAVINEFPWRCSMFWSHSKTGFQLFCGCSIISKEYILTAAHCVSAFPDRQIYVDASDYDISKNTEIANQVVKVDTILQHPDYNELTHDSDLALLKLEKPLNFSRSVSPVCLPWKFASNESESLFENASVVASGFGAEEENGKISKILRTVELPVLTTKQCQKYYGKGVVNENMMCTYEPGKDTCQGDSGSSIDFKDENTGQYYAIGVVSWGVGCSRQNYPGVYTKMHEKFLSWIESIVEVPNSASLDDDA